MVLKQEKSTGVSCASNEIYCSGLQHGNEKPVVITFEASFV